MRLLSQISLPNGKHVTGIMRMFAIASGIPMMVIAWAAAVVRCPIASHSPAMINHSPLLRAENPPALEIARIGLQAG